MEHLHYLSVKDARNQILILYGTKTMNIRDYIKSRFRLMTDDPVICDELTQIVDVILFKRGYQCINENKFKSLIGLIVKSVYIDYYRKKKKEIREELTKDLLSNYNADHKINKKEQDKFISDMLDKLTEKQRDAVILRYFFGLPYKEIARLMKCPHNTALGHIHNAKSKLFLTIKNNNL
jgi:RNA polymerase sigma-70 factor (ECF subfamily)